MFDEDYYLKFFTEVACRKTERIKKYYAYELIRTGLKAKFGDKAVWLQQYDDIVEWLKDSKGYGILVIGDKGLGKSVICRDLIPAILNENCHECGSERCLVTTAYNLASNGDELNLHSPKFIMIDDVGTEGEFVKFGVHRNMFMETVDFAEQHGKGLILTSNLTIEQLNKKYGERTTDRLKSLCRLVKIEGDSLRSGQGHRTPIPDKFRAYGIDFNSKQEMDNFVEEQRNIKNRIDNGSVIVFKGDLDEYHEGQPMKIVKSESKTDVAYALMKHDWSKYEEHVKKKEEDDRIPF